MKTPDVDAPRLFQGQGRTFLRSLLAACITSVAALLAAGLWIAGQAQYLEDYCFTRVEPPEASPPEALSGRPAYWDDPVTVACEFDGFPTIYTTEPAPLFGALLLAGAVVAVALIAFHWARPERIGPRPSARTCRDPRHYDSDPQASDWGPRPRVRWPGLTRPTTGILKA